MDDGIARLKLAEGSLKRWNGPPDDIGVDRVADPYVSASAEAQTWHAEDSVLLQVRAELYVVPARRLWEKEERTAWLDHLIPDSLQLSIELVAVASVGINIYCEVSAFCDNSLHECRCVDKAENASGN